MTKIKTNKQLNDDAKQNKPDNAKIPKTSFKNAIANGKVAKRNVMPLANDTEMSKKSVVRSKQFVKEESDDEDSDDSNGDIELSLEEQAVTMDDDVDEDDNIDNELNTAEQQAEISDDVEDGDKDDDDDDKLEEDSDDSEVKNSSIAIDDRTQHKKATIKGPTSLQKKLDSKNYANEEYHNIDENCLEVYVGNISKSTENDLRAHFKPCGDIVSIAIHNNPNNRHAFIQFTNTDAGKKALELNCSMLNSSILIVRKPKRTKPKDSQLTRRYPKCPELTLNIKKTNNVDICDVAKLRNIFGKCGKITDIYVQCSGPAIGYITFENPTGFRNAFLLNGTTVDGLAVDIEQYRKPINKVLVKNLQDTVTNEEIIEHFKDAGTITHIVRKFREAILEFKTRDEFCKSFSLDESFLKSIIYLEPYSSIKSKYVQHKRNNNTLKPKDNGRSPKPNSFMKKENFRKHNSRPYFGKRDGPPTKRTRPNF